MTCTSLDMSTSVLMSGYTKHLQCPEYIQNRNAQVNGRITRWRTGTLKLLEQVEQSGLYLAEDYANQYKFADKIIGKLQEGLNNVNVFPIDILNKEMYTLFAYILKLDTTVGDSAVVLILLWFLLYLLNHGYTCALSSEEISSLTNSLKILRVALSKFFVAGMVSLSAILVTFI
jgi:hypothetical protein